MHRIAGRTSDRRRWFSCCVWLGVCAWGCAPVFGQARVVAILVADTLSEDIRADMSTNIGLLGMALRDNLPADRLDENVLVDRDYASRRIEQVIANTRVDPGDTLFFFYCGHGFYQPGVGSYLAPPSDQGARLYLKDIRNQLEAKQARFTLSILDSCSVIPGGVNSMPAPGPPGLPPRPAQPSAHYEALFFQPTGTFHINSSRPGEYAICRTSVGDGIVNGSLFTSLLCRQLGTRGRRTDWVDVYRELKADVDAGYRRLYPQGVITLGNGGTVSQRSQTVWAFQNNRELE